MSTHIAGHMGFPGYVEWLLYKEGGGNHGIWLYAVPYEHVAQQRTWQSYVSVQ